MTENNSVHDKGNSFLSKVIALLSLLLPLFIVVMVVLLSERHYHRWDLTSTGEHTLSEETIQVLKGITRPIRITAFVREGYEEKDEAERLLSTYHYYSPKISYRLIDPDRNPTMTCVLMKFLPNSIIQQEPTAELWKGRNIVFSFQ